jgi:transposase
MSTIDAYRPYLQERWQAGCRSTEQLWRELQQRGFTGSWKMVYRWVQVQTDAGLQIPEQTQGHRPTTAKRMAPRHLAWLFLHDPEQLGKQERLTLSLFCQDKSLAQAYAFSQQFVAMVKERNPTGLEAWLRGCQMSGIAELKTVAQGLETEASALRAALTLPHSNGPVEGKSIN